MNAVAPGAIETEMLNVFSEEDKNEIAEEIPLGRLGLPEEVAKQCRFLYLRCILYNGTNYRSERRLALLKFLT